MNAADRLWCGTVAGGMPTISKWNFSRRFRESSMVVQTLRLGQRPFGVTSWPLVNRIGMTTRCGLTLKNARLLQTHWSPNASWKCLEPPIRVVMPKRKTPGPPQSPLGEPADIRPLCTSVALFVGSGTTLWMAEGGPIYNRRLSAIARPYGPLYLRSLHSLVGCCGARYCLPMRPSLNGPNIDRPRVPESSVAIVSVE